MYFPKSSTVVILSPDISATSRPMISLKYEFKSRILSVLSPISTTSGNPPYIRYSSSALSILPIPATVSSTSMPLKPRNSLKDSGYSSYASIRPLSGLDGITSFLRDELTIKRSFPFNNSWFLASHPSQSWTPVTSSSKRNPLSPNHLSTSSSTVLLSLILLSSRLTYAAFSPSLISSCWSMIRMLDFPDLRIPVIPTILSREFDIMPPKSSARIFSAFFWAYVFHSSNIISVAFIETSILFLYRTIYIDYCFSVELFAFSSIIPADILKHLNEFLYYVVKLDSVNSLKLKGRVL